MHELLTQPKTPEIPRQVAGIKSEWWPASNRNGGRHQIGIPGRLPSESTFMRPRIGNAERCGFIRLGILIRAQAAQ